MTEFLQIEIVTPEKMVVNDTATEITVPGKDGYLGILPGHAPLISELAIGEITYRVPTGQYKHLACAWGFVEVLPDKVTILAELAERAEDIDLARAKRDKERAEDIVKNHAADQDVSKAANELARANARIAAAEKIQGQLSNLLP